MWWLVFSIILVVVLWIAFGYIFNGADKYGKMKFKANKKQTFSLLGLLLITFGLFTIVPANNVGIIYSPFSGVSQNTLSEGIHGKGLFSKVYKISTEIQTKKLKDISGQTKDSQFVTLTADVKYKVDNAKAFEVFKQYRNLKNISNDLITPVVQRSIESVTTQYNIIDVLGAERNNVYKQIEADLKTRLEANGITFILINFDDTDAGDEIEAAIQREAIAKKDAETAEQQRLKNLTEQQQKVDNANVEKQEAEIKAQTTKINAEAEAIRYKIISDAITPQLIEKWTADARIAHGWVTVKGGNVITDNR